MKNLIVIYGAPRTGTTHLWEAIRKHPQVFGDESTNEPSFDVEADYELDMFWDRQYEIAGSPSDPSYLVIKAPGYGSKWDFFKDLADIGFNASFIFTDRDMLEVVDSMRKHEQSRQICDFDIESTDCPEHLLERYREKWDSCGGLQDVQRIIRRCYYRYSWHE